MRTRVKICCIQSLDEARMAIQRGADAIGLVSAMPSGPGPITEELITEIAETVRREFTAHAAERVVETFLLTCLTDPEEIAAQQQRCGTTTVQLCDTLAPTAYAELCAAMPRVSLVQVIHVRNEKSLAEAVAIAPHVDALLLDSGNPSLAVKELGGTGRVHDWAVSRAIRERVSVPVWLAGGLNPSNVAQAINQVQPFGVDICSGLRPAGALDRALVQQFVAAVGNGGA